jgi:hypothetical protein
MTEPLDDARACENTDREIWRGPDEGGGDYYADSLHITKGGGLGINCGGSVYVKPIREWHRLAGGPISGLRPTPVPQCEAELSRDERHAIGHARHLTEQTTAENPECCFHRDLVKDLLRIIDRAAAPARCDAESARAAAVEECARRVESTSLRNPDNIARDIRALSPDPGTVAVTSTLRGSPAE